MKTNHARQIQEAFFERAADDLRLMADMFNTLDCVTFNVLDAKDRIIAYSRSNCVKCNFASEASIVGKSCYELFPKVDADVYVRRNRKVRKSGKPIINVPYHACGDRSIVREICSIFPVHDRAGKIIGTTAVHRRLPDARDTPEDYGPVNRAIAYIDAHFAERITLKTLAAISGMGESNFSHTFKRIMETSPGDYIMTIRLNHARKLLEETDLSILSIALECGFFDQSHFIRTFIKIRKMTPNQYRIKYKKRSGRGTASR